MQALHWFAKQGASLGRLVSDCGATWTCSSWAVLLAVWVERGGLGSDPAPTACAPGAAAYQR